MHLCPSDWYNLLWYLCVVQVKHRQGSRNVYIMYLTTTTTPHWQHMDGSTRQATGTDHHCLGTCPNAAQVLLYPPQWRAWYSVLLVTFNEVSQYLSRQLRNGGGGESWPFADLNWIPVNLSLIYYSWYVYGDRLACHWTQHSEKLLIVLYNMDLGFQEIRTDYQILLHEGHYSNVLEIQVQ
jgi:hypothetical protein